MNRPIKFRAWNGQRMIGRAEDEGDYCVTFGGEVKLQAYGTPPFNILLPQGLTLMQFTGLLDKNGKECFESDIIDHLGEVFEVVWDAEGVWMAKGVSELLDPRTGDSYQIGDVMLCDRIKVAEIVGNIYEG